MTRTIFPINRWNRHDRWIGGYRWLGDLERIQVRLILAIVNWSRGIICVKTMSLIYESVNISSFLCPFSFLTQKGKSEGMERGERKEDLLIPNQINNCPTLLIHTLSISAFNLKISSSLSLHATKIIAFFLDFIFSLTISFHAAITVAFTSGIFLGAFTRGVFDDVLLIVVLVVTSKFGGGGFWGRAFLGGAGGFFGGVWGRAAWGAGFFTDFLEVLTRGECVSWRGWSKARMMRKGNGDREGWYEVRWLAVWVDGKKLLRNEIPKKRGDACLQVIGKEAKSESWEEKDSNQRSGGAVRILYYPK